MGVFLCPALSNTGFRTREFFKTEHVFDNALKLYLSDSLGGSAQFVDVLPAWEKLHVPYQSLSPEPEDSSSRRFSVSFSTTTRPSCDAIQVGFKGVLACFDRLWILPSIAFGFAAIPENQIFRFLLIDRLHRVRVLSDDIATNLMSWPHSGFHLHHSEPFSPNDRDEFLRRLAYAFRTPVSLSRLSYDGENRVSLQTRAGAPVEFTPLEFLAHLTAHIPDRYQHMRRYAGLYASATRRHLGLKTKASRVHEEGKSITPRWASLLAHIFGSLPIECPRCRVQMKLSGFETDLRQIQVLIPELSRAPPRKKLETFFDIHEKIPFLVAAEGIDSFESEAEGNQLRVESDQEFDQTVTW